MKISTASIRAAAICVAAFLAAFFAVRFGLAFGADSDAWLNDQALAGTIADIEARREQILTQLSVNIASIMVIAFAASILWILWWMTKSSKVARPDRSADGRRTWTVLALVIALVSASLFVRFGWFTVTGNYLTDTARIVTGLALIGVPLVVYWLIACITTPNSCHVSVPFSTWAIRSGGR